MGYDGTNKSSRTNRSSQPIRYWEATSPYLENLKAQIISRASKQAVDFLRPLAYKGPNILVDGGALEDDETSTSNEKWLMYRRKYVGGSDASAILGVNHYKTNLDLYYDKIGALPLPKDEDDDEGSFRRKLWGHLAEEFIARCYQRDHPGERVIVDTNMYTMNGRPYIGGDVDGIIRMPDGHYAVLEIKTTSFFNREAWANNSIPIPYEVQLRHYMAIMGLWEARIVCMVDPTTFYVRKLTRNLDKEFELVKAIDEFWKNHVEKKEPPKAIGAPDAVIRSLRKYKFGNKLDKQLPNQKLGSDIYNRCVEYDSINERYKEVKAELDRLDNLRKEATIPLVEAMGQATDGYAESVDGRTLFILKQSTKKVTSADKNWAKENLDEDTYDHIFKTKESAPTLTIKKTVASKSGMNPVKP